MKRFTDRTWLLAALAAVLLLGLPTLLYPLGRDQAMFAYIGDRWLKGDLPYRDAWDIKPPGIFALYALALTLFGRSALAPRIADLLGVLAIAAVLYHIARPYGGALRAFVAPVLFALGYFLSLGYAQTAQAESLAGPFTVLMAGCLLRARSDPRARWLLSAGLCFGLAVLIKTSYVLLGPLLLYALLPAEGLPRVRRALLLLAGSAALPAAAALYFAAHGAFGYLVELFQAQASYADVDGVAALKGFAAAWRWWMPVPAATLCVIPALFALLAAGRRDPVVRFSLVWLLLAGLAWAAQRRFWTYQAVPLLPPLALLSAATLAEVVRRAAALRRRALRAAAGVLLAAAAFALIRPTASAYYGKALALRTRRITRVQYWARLGSDGDYSYRDNSGVASYLRRHTEPGEPVLLAVHEPAMLFLADRASPTRHLSPIPLYCAGLSPVRFQERWRAEQLRDLAARPPRYVVTCLALDPYGAGQSTEFALAGCRFRFERAFGSFRVYRRE